MIGRDPTYERWRATIFATSWLAYFGFYLTRRSFSVTKKILSVKMDWSVGVLGWIDFAYLVTYAVGGILCGMLGDRFGARKFLLVGILASVVTAILMGASSNLILFGALFAVQGLCQSAGWACPQFPRTLLRFFLTQRERGRGGRLVVY